MSQEEGGEIARLRAALIETGNALGAGLGEGCSTEFLCGVPEEARLVVARLRREAAAANARASLLESQLAAVTAAVRKASPSCVEAMSFCSPETPAGSLDKHRAACEECRDIAALDAALSDPAAAALAHDEAVRAKALEEAAKICDGVGAAGRSLYQGGATNVSWDAIRAVEGAADSIRALAGKARR